MYAGVTVKGRIGVRIILLTLLMGQSLLSFYLYAIESEIALELVSMSCYGKRLLFRRRSLEPI